MNRLKEIERELKKRSRHGHKPTILSMPSLWFDEAVVEYDNLPPMSDGTKHPLQQDEKFAKDNFIFRGAVLTPDDAASDYEEPHIP